MDNWQQTITLPTGDGFLFQGYMDSETIFNTDIDGDPELPLMSGVTYLGNANLVPESSSLINFSICLIPLCFCIYRRRKIQTPIKCRN